MNHGYGANWPASNWYDAVYGDDPSTDNVFGRESLAPRRNPLLRAWLAQGGRLSDFARIRSALTVLELAPAISARLLPDGKDGP